MNEWEMQGPKDKDTPDDDDHAVVVEEEHGLAEEGQGGLEHKNDERVND